MSVSVLVLPSINVLDFYFSTTSFIVIELKGVRPTQHMLMKLKKWTKHRDIFLLQDQIRLVRF